MFNSSWPSAALLSERKKILAAAQREADEAFARDPIDRQPVAVTVPKTESHCDYNTPGGM
jgi:hypothetical protein